MAGFLSGLGSFSGGAAQGIQSGVELAQRLQQIKQGQMALDTAKKQLAADPAVANWLQQAQGASGAPPMGLPGPGGPMPPQGQGAPPAPPQGPQQPAAAMPPGQPSVPGGSPPQGQAGPTPPGPATAPPPQAGGGASLPAPGQGEDPSSPQAAFKVMQTVASQIKAANPNIDPHTLLYATQEVIDMSKGIEPGLRAQASFLANQLRAQVSLQNNQNTNATHVETTEMNNATSTGNTGTKVAAAKEIAAGHDATSLQRVQQQGLDAMARTQAGIDGANKRAAAGTWSREKATAYKERANAAGVKLKAANSRLTSLTAAGVKPDDPRVAQASKDISTAASELDRVNKAAGLDAMGSPGGTAPAGQPAPAPGAATRPTATSADGKTKLEWDGKAWVPAGK